jgi:hypothetical protein
MTGEYVRSYYNRTSASSVQNSKHHIHSKLFCSKTSSSYSMSRPSNPTTVTWEAGDLFLASSSSPMAGLVQMPQLHPSLHHHQHGLSLNVATAKSIANHCLKLLPQSYILWWMRIERRNLGPVPIASRLQEDSQSSQSPKKLKRQQDGSERQTSGPLFRYRREEMLLSEELFENDMLSWSCFSKTICSRGLALLDGWLERSGSSLFG